MIFRLSSMVGVSFGKENILYYLSESENDSTTVCRIRDP